MHSSEHPSTIAKNHILDVRRRPAERRIMGLFLVFQPHFVAAQRGKSVEQSNSLSKADWIAAPFSHSAIPFAIP
jgi:hypothetical protein